MEEDDIQNSLDGSTDESTTNIEVTNKRKRKRKVAVLSEYFYRLPYYKDKSFLIELDDKTIISEICSKYTDFKVSAEVKELKKLFLEILDDYLFIYSILDSRNITFEDFLSTIIRHYDKMFNSIVYLRKIRDKATKYGYKLD